MLFSHSVFATPWTSACRASLSFTLSQSLLKLVSIELMMLSNYVILCHPLLLLPSMFPNIRVFYNELVFHIRWPEYWNFSFSISPSNEYSGLISLNQPSQKCSPAPQFESINSLLRIKKKIKSNQF